MVCVLESMTENCQRTSFTANVGLATHDQEGKQYIYIGPCEVTPETHFLTRTQSPSTPAVPIKGDLHYNSPAGVTVKYRVHRMTTGVWNPVLYPTSLNLN